MHTDTLGAPYLQRVHELRAAGNSLRKIAAMLQKEGVRLPPHSRKWNHMTVQWCVQQLEALPAPSVPSSAAVPAPAEVDPPPAASPSAPALHPLTGGHLKMNIQGPWIATDYLLWEFLILQAGEALAEKTDHTIPLQAGLKGLRLTPRRRDRAHLRDAFARLVASHVTLEIQLKEELLSLSAPLISGWLTQDSLTFQFPTAVVKIVKNPQQYIRLKELFAAKQ